MDQGYVEKDLAAQIIDSCKKLSIMINNFMEYFKKTPFKGKKYKKPPRKSMKEEVEEIMRDLNTQKS